MPIPFEIYCPDATCPGKIEVGDDGIAFCSHCGMQVGVWSTPRPRHRRYLPSAKSLTILALILLCVGMGFWAGAGIRGGEHLRSPATLSPQDFLGIVKAGEFPPDLDLPAFYKDPNLFLQEDQRRAQSGFVVFWNGLSDDQKLTILNVLNDAEDPTFIPFLIEIAYFTLPVENDELIGAGILGGLNGSTWPFLDLLIFVTEYVANNAICSEVAEYAQRDLISLYARRQRYGR